MGRTWVDTKKIGLAACSLAFLEACSPGPKRTDERNTLPQYVVLTHTDMTDGPISGSVSCRDSAGRQIMSDQCLPSRQILEEAVFACGPTMVTIDQSWTHSWSVAFPVDWKPGKPSAVDVVRCVKGHVGFGFSAVIAPPPKLGEVPGADGDSKPFLPLHRR
ncbi:hypothetical protein PP1Y_AT23028 [Novosphingobium sp. PP1Y]|nr:hypothetical protein PP1Y_AT23028 [Novosphingobium sp. PP1Y]